MIALVWNGAVPLVSSSVRYELYAEGLLNAGEETVTVCMKSAADGYPYPLETVDNERQLTDADFWRRLGCRGLVMITWHRMTNILLAARAAGVKTLAICDSDGQVDVRANPSSTFRFITGMQQTFLGKVGAAKYWLEKFTRHSGEERRQLLENVEAADITTLGGTGPVGEFRRLLMRLDASEQAIQRVAELPYPVPDYICASPVLSDRANQVIAVGRWGASQKNAKLLEQTIRRVAEAQPEVEFVVVGPDSERVFAKLSRDLPRVHVLGVRPRPEVAQLLADSRVLLFSSRWEGAPVTANEMLATGGTVVGTPLPSLVGITENGRFGRVSDDHTAAGLSAALVNELTAWSQGHRDPTAIANHWRQHVCPGNVGRRILDLLDLRPSPSDAASKR